MFNWNKLKMLAYGLAIIVLGVTASPVLPQVAKADPPYDCVNCKYDFNVINTLYYWQLVFNRYDDPYQYTGTAFNEDEWDNNIVWTDPNQAKFAWGDLTDPAAHDLGYELRTLRPLYEDPQVWDQSSEVTALDTRLDTAEGDIDALQIAVGAISVPDDLGDLAPGNDSNHFTDADEAKLDALPSAATLTSNFAAKYNTPAGTTSQVVLGDGTLGTLPTATVYYDNTTQRTGVKALFKSGVVGDVTAGNVVYYLSSDNTATGTALCPNNVFLDGLQLRAQEGTTPHAFGTAAVTNSNRTLTIPVSKIAPILGILNLNQAATGTTVKATVYCN